MAAGVTESICRIVSRACPASVNPFSHRSGNCIILVVLGLHSHMAAMDIIIDATRGLLSGSVMTMGISEYIAESIAMFMQSLALYCISAQNLTRLSPLNTPAVLTTGHERTGTLLFQWMVSRHPSGTPSALIKVWQSFRDVLYLTFFFPRGAGDGDRDSSLSFSFVHISYTSNEDLSLSFCPTFSTSFFFWFLYPSFCRTSSKDFMRSFAASSSNTPSSLRRSISGLE